MLPEIIEAVGPFIPPSPSISILLPSTIYVALIWLTDPDMILPILFSTPDDPYMTLTEPLIDP